MDTFENNINLAYKYLPSPFKEFNETAGKRIYNELLFESKEDGKENNVRNLLDFLEK
jgi:hypothetical protein